MKSLIIEKIDIILILQFIENIRMNMFFSCSTEVITVRIAEVHYRSKIILIIQIHTFKTVSPLFHHYISPVLL